MNIAFKTEIEDKFYNIKINSITVDDEVPSILKIDYEYTDTKENFYYYDEKLSDKVYLSNKDYINNLIEEKKYTNDKINELIKKSLKDHYFEQLVIDCFVEFHNG